jgi:hypothetical protein
MERFRLLGIQVACVNNKVRSLNAKLAFLNIGSLAITKVRANGAHSVNLIVCPLMDISTRSTISGLPVLQLRPFNYRRRVSHSSQRTGKRWRWLGSAAVGVSGHSSCWRLAAGHSGQHTRDLR